MTSSRSSAQRVADRYLEALEETYFRKTAASLTVEDQEGQAGNKGHLTRYEEGTLPTSEVLKIDPPYDYHGRRDWNEKGGIRYFGNYREDDWNEFLEDIRRKGIKTPLWIMVDPGKKPVLMEGSHRLQAAIQLKIREMPVYIKYYGHAERKTLVAPRVHRKIIKTAIATASCRTNFHRCGESELRRAIKTLPEPRQIQSPVLLGSS